MNRRVVIQTCNICKDKDRRAKGYTATGQVWKNESKAPSFWCCDQCYPLAFRKPNPKRGRGRTRRVRIPTREQWFKSVRDSWDSRRHCFRCQITHVALDLKNKKSPVYPTLEHAYTRKGAVRFLVVASAINDMKSDLTLSEFRKAIPLVCKCLKRNPHAKHVKGLEKVLKKLKQWRR